MKYALFAALMASSFGAVAGEPCSWDTPGHNPFKGSPVAAIMSYEQIPMADRLSLAARVQAGRRPDDTPDITATGISSVRYKYITDVHDMHFGRSGSCKSVTRFGWAPGAVQPAKSYFAGKYAIIIPNVCGNISWAMREVPIVTQSVDGRSVKNIPEPGSLALVTVAGLAAWISRRGVK
jgi:hypothetical protein